MSVQARILDTVARTAPLGVRFWDLATQRPVADGLSVTARSAARPDKPRPLTPNASGVHVLHAAPEISEGAWGDGSDAFWAGVARAPFTLEVRDLKGRFLPLTLAALAPHRGYLAVAPASPIGDAHQLLAACAPPGYVALFSAPARPAGAGQALIRANLRRRGDEALAAGALVVAETVLGQTVGFGMADARGDLALVFPFPELERRPPTASPPAAAPGAGPVFTATVALRAFHDQAAPPLGGAPDATALLSQPEAALLARQSPRAVLGDLTLQLGDELRVETQDGQRSLYVD